MDHQHATPIRISADGQTSRLERIPLQGAESSSAYNEDWLQDLLFKHPESLPLLEIDPAFSNPIPVVRELNTAAGPLDVLYITPQGKLIVLEAKLWRNPEARRQVIGQILDYAKELSAWTLEDLEREVSRLRRKITGQATRIYDLVRDHPSALPEADFNDAMARCLRQGEFMLLIVGDGIRQGAASIAEFLERNGTLLFTFGLVEMAIYRTAEQDLLLCPRILAQTTIIKRSVISLQAEGLVVSDTSGAEASETPRELTDLDRFYLEFWPEFLGKLKLDDPGQPMAKPTRVGNIFFSLPSSSDAWITVYFWQQRKEIGVFLTFTRGSQQGDSIFKRLADQKDEINKEIAFPLSWESEGGKHKIVVRRQFDDLCSPGNREQIKQWFADVINRYVNTFRPRIERILAET